MIRSYVVNNSRYVFTKSHNTNELDFLRAVEAVIEDGEDPTGAEEFDLDLQLNLQPAFDLVSASLEV